MMQRILVWWEKEVGAGRKWGDKRTRGDNQHGTEERGYRKNRDNIESGGKY